MRKKKIEFYNDMLRGGFSAMLGDDEIAHITEHGSTVWKISEDKTNRLPIEIIVSIQMFAEGVAHYASTGMEATA